MPPSICQCVSVPPSLGLLLLSEREHMSRSRSDKFDADKTSSQPVSIGCTVVTTLSFPLMTLCD